MEKLVFHPVAPGDKELIYKYMSVYGEGSCQHSFVSMLTLAEKYLDSVCEKDGFLYTLRAKLCTEKERVYLAPMGPGDLETAYRRVIEDAHSYGAKAKFYTLTKKHADYVEKHFPGMFEIYDDRDLAEYVYQAEKMAYFPGGELKKRRFEVNHFHTVYGERAAVTRITENDIPEIMAFENAWLAQNCETHDRAALERECRAIEKQLKSFDALDLSGIVLRIDGKMRGYGYGTPLNDEYYDALIEKGDRDVPDIYKVLRCESVRQCALNYKYINVEEDVGVEGLRAVKEAYRPEFLIHKYIVTEI